MSSINALTLLPATLADESISINEIVLPFNLALEAIDCLEREGVQILGWEGQIKTTDARICHANPPQGSTSLDALTVHDAAKFCKETITEDYLLWLQENSSASMELYFCITVKD